MEGQKESWSTKILLAQTIRGGLRSSDYWQMYFSSNFRQRQLHVATIIRPSKLIIAAMSI